MSAPMKLSQAVTGPWLDPPRAAAYLSMTLKALYQGVRRGTIPAHRLGRRLRFSQQELDAVLSAATTQTPLVESIERRLSAGKEADENGRC